MYLEAFVVSTAVVALGEIGDKTQIATVRLAAKCQSLVAVTAGTRLGLMLANVPAVLLGNRVVRRVPVHWVHRIAAAVFALLGVLVLLGIGG
jgi:putative Ca2+/H+ antiporter (TMEM165/GDT1 family)